MPHIAQRLSKIISNSKAVFFMNSRAGIPALFSNTDTVYSQSIEEWRILDRLGDDCSGFPITLALTETKGQTLRNWEHRNSNHSASFLPANRVSTQTLIDTCCEIHLASVASSKTW